MADPAAAFHAAQDAVLRASAELAALWPGGVARIYSVVPQNAPLPYVVIGDDALIEDSDECVSGSEIVATVHVWTRPDPPDVLLGRQIAGVVRELLATELAIAGFDTVLGEFVSTRHLTDPDGSSHAVLGFRYFTTALEMEAPLMATIKHARGVQLLLKVGDGETPEVFTVYCTINAARSIAGEAATNDFNIPDCDDPDAVGWLAREKVSLSYSVNGAGILNTPDAIIFAEWLEDPLPRNCEIVVDVPAADGGIEFAGAFHLTTFEITGDRGSKMEASIGLVSDGPVTVAAVAVLAADEEESGLTSRAGRRPTRRLEPAA